MARREITNLLALAVLALLVERPMHPYEMSRTMRERAKEASIKLNYGSLYSVVDQLQRHGAIEAQETTRDGRRPERTVYRITDAGRAKFDGWLSDILRRPAKEYPRFEAGLSLLPGLPPDRAVAMLEERVERLRKTIAEWREQFAGLEGQLPRLLWIEHDYEISQLESELTFVENLINEIKNETLDGMAFWHEETARRERSDASDPPIETG